MTKHRLKIWPQFYEAHLTGEKRFEIRKNDRMFQKGDVVILQEWSPETGYSGRDLWRKITYVASGFGLENGYVVFGTSDT